MIIKQILLAFLVFISPLFPPVIIPFSYWIVALLLAQNYNPLILCIITIIPAALSSLMIRFFYWYVHKKIIAYKEKKDNKDIISRIEHKIAKYIENKKKLSKINQKIKSHLWANHWQLLLFLITILAIDSAIPDFVIVWIVRKKLNFWLFIIAAIIGKTIVYAPVILIWKWILTLFGIK